MIRAIAGFAAAVVFGVAPVSSAEPLERLPESPRLRVLAWYSLPPDQSTVDRTRELAEAGFTESYSNFPSVASVLSALDAAQVAGIKLWPHLQALIKDPEGTVRKLQNHPALGGYVLTDEPGANQFANLAAMAARIRAIDSTHPCYINLFPNYATAKQLQVKSYHEYIERYFREVPDLPISFDFYPIAADRLNNSWYDNLELIADTAREARRPFWAFALSVAFGDHPIATTEHLRLQVYSDLAYGAQTIQYFTYWTPPAAPPGDDFHDGPIGLTGSRGLVYDRLKEVNAELKALSAVFVDSHVEHLGHTGEQLPSGTQRYEPIWPVKELDAKSGAVVSHLANDRGRYLMVVNRDFQKPMELSITFDPAAGASVVGKDGRIQKLANERYQTTVAPGDAAILTWTARGAASGDGQK